MSKRLLDVRDLRVGFPSANGVNEVVKGVSFGVSPGEAVGIVGESGSGKSVSALAVMQLVASPGRIVGGQILFDGEDVATFDETRMRGLRGRDISMVFQDPLSSLNPAFTIGQQLIDTIRAHRKNITRRAARDRAVEALELVGIVEAGRRLSSYPHEFSGGMRQRVMIALAIACEPRLLIADEPTTALDVTIQAQVVALLWRLQQELNLAVLFISHNLDLVAEICDRVYVMNAGRVVEEGGVEDIFLRPRHPYTRMLQNCIPRIDGSAPWSAVRQGSGG